MEAKISESRGQPPLRAAVHIDLTEEEDVPSLPPLQPSLSASSGKEQAETKEQAEPEAEPEPATQDQAMELTPAQVANFYNIPSFFPPEFFDRGSSEPNPEGHGK